MDVIAVANQKGGVGKTTLVVNLASALALAGKRVLVVDMDFQANATVALLGQSPTEGEVTMAHVLVAGEQVRLEDAIRETASPGVWVAAASDDLARADLSLATKMGRESVLRRALRPLEGKYDIVLVDTSPYLGLLTVNALVASRHVLVPVSAEFFPMLGLKLLGETIEEVRRQMDSPLDVLGYCITLYDRRLGLTNEVIDILTKRFGELVMDSKVRVNSNLKAAPAHRKDIFQFEAGTKKPWKGVEDFTALAQETLSRLKKVAEKAA